MPYPSEAVAGIGTILAVGDSGAGAGTVAAVEWGTSNAKIRIKWREAGVVGNGKNITVAVSGSSYVKTTLSAAAISITVPTSATVAQVIAYLYADETFQTYWDADYGASPGDGSGTITARTVTATSGGADGAEVFTAIAEVRSLSGPNMSAAVIDVTNMESQNRTREFITSLIDPGELTFDLNFLPGNAGQQGLFDDMVAGTRRNFKITWSDEDASTWTFAGLVTSFQPSSALEEALTASLTVKVTGLPVWA
ncbi:hypothetical protein EKK58_02025 [Candidatus Dependentiae bacterium]|nr:MAG: hypothetical protein EKK58_02025 [Candidatus Dependentiae bacterium]